MSTTSSYSWWQEGILAAIDGHFEVEQAQITASTVQAEQAATDPDPATNPVFMSGSGGFLDTMASNSQGILLASLGLLGVALVIKGLK